MAIIVTLPFVSRPVALPVLGALAVKGGRSKPDLARDLVDMIAEHFGDREIHIVADAAYGCGAFIGLGEGMSITTRAKANAVFSQLAPPRTGKRGRPRRKGERIGTPTELARSATWRTVSVSRYGTTSTVQIAEQTCLWYGTWRTDTVRVILVRETGTTSTPPSGYHLALVTTDLHATPEAIIARYAARWSIGVTFFDVKNLLGVGQARNRVPKAVERTVPFGLFCHSILILWYTLHGHDHTDTASRRSAAPWYRTKTEPATWDMLLKLRRQIIAARFLPTTPRPATTPRNPGSPASLGSRRRMNCKSPEVWWINKIAVTLANRLCVTPDDLDGVPFTERGGVDGFVRDFGDDHAEQLLDELNRTLPA